MIECNWFIKSCCTYSVNYPSNTVKYRQKTNFLQFNFSHLITAVVKMVKMYFQNSVIVWLINNNIVLQIKRAHSFIIIMLTSDHLFIFIHRYVPDIFFWLNIHSELPHIQATVIDSTSRRYYRNMRQQFSLNNLSYFLINKK